MSTSLTLNVIRGGEVVTSQVVEGELVKIGRMASAHLRIDDPKVSRIHAMLEVGADGRVSLIDMGSAQGTLVDGKPISKVALSSGDRRRGDLRRGAFCRRARAGRAGERRICRGCA